MYSKVGIELNSSSIINKLKRNSNLKVRESNFELMRIISMLFIILWHIIIHGHMIENCTSNAIQEYLKIIEFIIIVHVDSFIVVSGYFQSKSKFKLSKLLNLILQVVMYSFIIYLISIKVGLVNDYNKISIVQKMLPSTTGSYWFISTYIIVYILSDFINKFIEKLSRQEFKNLLMLLFVVFSVIPYITGGRILRNDGYNFYNFIFLYMIGAYLRRYPLKDSYHFRNLSINGYRVFLVGVFLGCVILNHLITRYAFTVQDYDNFFADFSSRIMDGYMGYSSMFVIIQTVCFFEFFRYINIKSRVINYISSCTFGIYLFHENNSVRSTIYHFFKIDNGAYSSYKMLIYMFAVMFGIFILGVIIETIRKIIIQLISRLGIVKKNINGFKDFCLSFNLKINW